MKSETYKKEFIKLMDKFGYKYSRWNIWNDFMYLTATSMANVSRSANWQEREEQYLKIINKYTKEERQLFVEMFVQVILAFEDNLEQDFLGELYHMMNLHQNQKGQFFTPYHIAEFMAELNMGREGLEKELAQSEKGYISVMDPAVGAGALLIAFANVCRKSKINYQQKVLFIAQDIDQTAALMCYIQLSIIGACAIIIVGDSLAKPGFTEGNDIWMTPMYYLNQWRFSSFWKKTEPVESVGQLETIDSVETIEADITVDYSEEDSGQLILNFGA